MIKQIIIIYKDKRGKRFTAFCDFRFRVTSSTYEILYADGEVAFSVPHEDVIFIGCMSDEYEFRYNKIEED